MLANIIEALIVLSFLMFMLIWFPCIMGRDDEEDVIWVSRNREISWFFTHFLTPHAVLYEYMCERLNGQGLAFLLIILSLLTLPVTIVMTAIGLVALFIRWVWRCFCNAYRREE